MRRTTVIGSGWTLGAALLALASAAGAYETDQLTWRERPLADALEPANAEADRLIDLAVERTNRATSCRADDERTMAVLAREIHQLTAARRWVWSRGFFRAPGFGAYAKWMETSPEVERFPFEEREDFFGELGVGQAFILSLAGPCSTFELAGVRLGSDKMDHFFDEGWRYWRHVRRGSDVRDAVDRGTRTENHFYGLSTSQAFSFADLRANWDGYLFYADLLEPDGLVMRRSDGCVERVGHFDWGRWVDWHYDEVLNPSVFTPRLQGHLWEIIDERAAQYCPAMDRWAPDGWEALRRTYALPPGLPWIGAKAPPPEDPYRLHAVCAPEPATAGR